MSEHNSGRRGLAYGITAYVMWGLVPLYWPLLKPTPALQILAHRMVWSVLFVAIVLLVRRRWSFVAKLIRDRRRLGLLTLAAVLVAVNWGVYIWAVNAGRVIDASLGYFINPLVTIALGVLVLRERLHTTQWVAVGFGGIAVAVITAGYGTFPWIALTLACSFGAYGLVKKVVGVPAIEGLAVETAVLAPAALIYLAMTELRGSGAFGHVALGTDLLLTTTGAVTVVPLLLFASAARQIPLSLLGFVQYLNPTLQFLIGRFVRHEALARAELAGFALVWVGIAVLGISEYRRWRASRTDEAPATRLASVAAGGQ